MFERTASLWRRLTGQRETATTLLADANEDRRAWVRHPSSLQTFFALAGEVEEQPAPAQVRDVSQGGIKLVVDRSFEPGALLNVTLPGAGGSSLNVLACVVHCQDLSGGQWAIGCSFSAELDERDLEAFGAKKARPRPEDGRYWERYDCNVKALCQLAMEPEAPAWAAKVLNISANGMALAVERQLPTGTLLSAELQGSKGSPPLTILACVVHVSEEPTGRRVTGCNFIRELSEADLQALT